MHFQSFVKTATKMITQFVTSLALMYTLHIDIKQRERHTSHVNLFAYERELIF